MAMRKCSECGQDISSKAASCPSCGAPIKFIRGKGTARKGGCLVMLVLLVLVIWGINKANERANSPEGKAESARRQAESDEKSAADKRAADAKRKSESEAQQRAATEAAAAVVKARKEAKEFPVDDVVAYYAANEVAGDEALKGRVFKVRGVVESIGNDLIGTPYVAFKASEGSFRTVQCMFNKDQKGQLAPIRPGQELTIYGKCTGLMVNVIMDDCEIMERE